MGGNGVAKTRTTSPHALRHRIRSRPGMDVSGLHGREIVVTVLENTWPHVLRCSSLEDALTWLRFVAVYAQL